MQHAFLRFMEVSFKLAAAFFVILAVVIFAGFFGYEYLSIENRFTHFGDNLKFFALVFMLLAFAFYKVQSDYGTKR